MTPLWSNRIRATLRDALDLPDRPGAARTYEEIIGLLQEGGIDAAWLLRLFPSSSIGPPCR